MAIAIKSQIIFCVTFSAVCTLTSSVCNVRTNNFLATVSRVLLYFNTGQSTEQHQLALVTSFVTTHRSKPTSQLTSTNPKATRSLCSILPCAAVCGFNTNSTIWQQTGNPQHSQHCDLSTANTPTTPQTKASVVAHVPAADNPVHMLRKQRHCTVGQLLTIVQHTIFAVRALQLPLPSQSSTRNKLLQTLASTMLHRPPIGGGTHR